jgi:hypothetical protein
MVALRSGGRQDAVLLAVVWVLTAAALALGVALAAPILIFWGVVGLAGAGFLTRIHLRTGARLPGGASGDAPDDDDDPADPAGPAGDEEKVP